METALLPQLAPSNLYTNLPWFSRCFLLFWTSVALVSLGSSTKAQAQATGFNPNVRNDIVPPAPTAASLGKFADVPVSLYTGKPQITVPLWDISSGKLHVPVALNYNAGGIKVEDIASWVGLGWALDAGGVVTRSVRGLPDDDVAGYWDTTNNTNFPNGGSYNSSEYDKYMGYLEGRADSQPDLFYFNFCGKTGKFVGDRSGGLIPIPYQNLKIVPLHGLNHLSGTTVSGGSVSGWQITAEDGTRYLFRDAEYSNSGSTCYSATTTSGAQPRNDYASSWFLSEIVSPANDRITFEYTEYNLPMYIVPSTQTKYTRKSYAGITSKYDEFCYNGAVLNHGKRLHKIIFATGELEFVPRPNRCDMRGDASLRTVLVRQTTPTPRVIRRFDLKQRYLVNGLVGDTLGSARYACPTTRDYTGESLSYRLMLMGVTELSGAHKKPPYEFTYLTTDYTTGSGSSLPNRMVNLSESQVSHVPSYYSQDHWGYFNGKVNEGTLVPAQQYSGTLLPGAGTPLPNNNYLLDGADRSASLPFAQLGSLAKITYPTGGSTTFEWALHSFAPFINSSTNSITPTPPTVDRHWSFYTYPPGSHPTPFIVNNANAAAAGGVTPVHIMISSYFPCTCSSSNPSPSTPSTQSCGPYCHVWFIIRDRATNSQKFIFSVNYLDRPQPPTYQVLLANGEYYLEHYHNVGGAGPNGTDQTSPDPARIYSITLDWTETESGNFWVGGGLRVAKTTDYDPVSKQRLVKEYEYDLPGGESSGTLVTFPQYGYDLTESITATGNCTGGSNGYFVRSSNSMAPLGVTQGSPVGYSRVSVYHTVAGEIKGSRGKTVYTYTSPSDYPDNDAQAPLFSMFPFAPANSRDWKRGLLTSQVDFRRAGIGYEPVKSLENNYNFYTDLEYFNPTVANSSALGVKVGLNFQQLETSCSGGSPTFSLVRFSGFPVAYRFFNTSTGYAVLTTSSITAYDGQDASKYTRTDTKYKYGLTHLLLSQESRKASNGDSLKTTYRYPDDYNAGVGVGQPAVAALQQMQASHVTTALVEKQEWLKRSTTDWQLLAGELTNFKSLNAGATAPNPTVVVPGERLVVEAVAPVVAPAVTTVANSALTFDNHYQLRSTFDAYTSAGRLLQQTQVPQQSAAYLWGTKQQSLIAEAFNATADRIAYTSFEDDEPSTWQYSGPADATQAATGTRSYPLNGGALLRSGLPIGEYAVACWAKGGAVSANGQPVLPVPGVERNGWRLHQLRLQVNGGSVTLSGNAQVDETRLLPVGAQMTTYTYDPLVGRTSETDAQHRITTYEYDGLGRLLCTRDAQGHVLTVQQYHYARP